MYYLNPEPHSYSQSKAGTVSILTFYLCFYSHVLCTWTFTCLGELISASIRVITISDSSEQQWEPILKSRSVAAEFQVCEGLSGKGTHVWCLNTGAKQLFCGRFAEALRRCWLVCCDMWRQLMTWFPIKALAPSKKKDIFFPEGVKRNQNLTLCSFSRALWLYLTNCLLTRRLYLNPIVKVKDTPLSALNYTFDDVP